MDRRDVMVLNSLLKFCFSNETDWIDISKFKASPEARAVLESIGGKLDDIIMILADRGYLVNLTKPAQVLLTCEVTGRAFEFCGARFGFPDAEKNLPYGAIRILVRHGAPMSGDELTEAMARNRKMPPLAVLLLAKLMKERGWIGFQRTKGCGFEITEITHHGRRAAEP